MAGINHNLQAVAPLKRTTAFVWMCVLLGLAYWVAMMGLYALIAAVSDRLVISIRHAQIAGLMASASATGCAVQGARLSGNSKAWLLLAGMGVATVLFCTAVSGVGAMGLVVLFGCFGVVRGALFLGTREDSWRGSQQRAESISVGFIVIELSVATLILSTGVFT